MNLYLFDIDGTITDSVKVDDECFIQTYKDVHGIDLDNTDWSTYQHATDTGLSNEIFERHFGKLPEPKELRQTKFHFISLILSRANEIKEIPGANDYLNKLLNDSDSAVGLATGGWGETAQIKLKAIGIDSRKIPFASSNDHYDRTKIIETALEKAKSNYNQDSFESITYIGDGVWDYHASMKLGINFRGIDFHSTGNLQDFGVTVYPDFTHITI